MIKNEQVKVIDCLLGRRISRIVFFKDGVATENYKYATEMFIHLFSDFSHNSVDGVMMCHNQECCEEVSIEDAEGDFSSLRGAGILEAEEIVSDVSTGGDYQLCTIYRFNTTDGELVIRWFGESNGHYSVDVDVYSFKYEKYEAVNMTPKPTAED